MSSFTVRLNPIIGKKEVIVNPEHYDFHQEVARSSYADMLHDKERNEKYYSAIKQAIKLMKEQGRTAKVLDIGTGTGLLSMMAVRSGADSVIACEAFRPVAMIAKNVIKENGFEDKIQVIPKNSVRLTVGEDGDLKERANILVAEVFDTELIGEGALETFTHALKNLLEPDSIVVPSSASVYIQIIDSEMLSNWNKLQSLYVDADKVIQPPKRVISCPGAAAVLDLQMSKLPEDKFYPLTNPICVFEFDFMGRKSIEMNETSINKIQAIKSGNCQVVFMWWCLQMDTIGNILLNNGPKWVQKNPTEVQWRDHWMQAVYYLPKAIRVSENDAVHLSAHHDEFSMWFDISKPNKSETSAKSETCPSCSCYAHITDSRTRIGMKNDAERNKRFIEILQKVITPSSICLCISDGSLLPLMAAKLGAKKVYAVETNHLHQTVTQLYVDANNESDIIKILNKEPSDLTPKDFEDEKIDILLAEPYIASCVHPWDVLYFLHLRKLLEPLLHPHASIIPEQGVIKAVAVDFEHLWKIRAPVGIVEGFNISKFDDMIQKAISVTDTAVEPQPLWEYKCIALTEAFNLLSFDFSSEMFKTDIETSGQQGIKSNGVCNGVALWVDYSSKGIKVSSGPVKPVIPGTPIEWYMNCQQGVYFIHPPTAISSQRNEILKYSLSFNLATGDMSCSFKIAEK